ncbi:FtsX-like permease family protein [Bacillus sp. UMB0728]|uniref:FtsX-like permease family protein n=1 Tax=Bacillus sp. UMB0728 TaxID=2066052 RepID=UPI0015DE550A|nr:ABC transporter permease [Bacillus sp. UMB0728]
MTLFELARRSFKGNRSQYLLYFYPMVFSILIYFTFVSLQYNHSLSSSVTALGKLEPAFAAASIMLLAFAAVFIWYSNAYFMKKRKKEIALYALYGLKKKQIGRLLFLEQMMMGVLALSGGILSGMLMSKFFAMLLIKVMGLSTITGFAFSGAAILQTIAVFSLIILLTSIYNYRLVYKHTLLELFQAEKKAEKQPKGSAFGAALSLLLAGSGYFLLLQPSSSAIWKDFGFLTILASLGAIALGTYLFLNCFIVILLKRLKAVQRIYYKGINLISLSHLLFRIKGNILALTIISLLSTFTLFTIGTAGSLYYNMNALANKNYPLSLLYTVENEQQKEHIMEMIRKNQKNPIKFTAEIPYLAVNADLSATGRFPDDYPALLIPETAYKKLAGELGHSTSDISGENFAIAFYDGNLKQDEDPYTGKNMVLPGGQDIRFSSYEKKSLLNQGLYSFPVVITDKLYSELRAVYPENTLQAVSWKNDKNAGTIASQIQAYYDSEMPDLETVIFSTFFHQHEKLMQIYGILIFISSFLGLTFLLATGSMLHYKQLSEAVADQDRYRVLKKIGMGRKQINAAILKQLFLIFALPFLGAVLHSSVIMLALTRFLKIDTLIPFILAAALYALIYFVYYFATARTYSRIVNE